MRFIAITLLLLCAAPAAIGEARAEVNYPWCLVMGGRDGSYSCGYVSLAQCQASRVGSDMCMLNGISASACSAAAPARPVIEVLGKSRS